MSSTSNLGFSKRQRPQVLQALALVGYELGSVVRSAVVVLEALPLAVPPAVVAPDPEPVPVLGPAAVSRNSV